MKYENRIRPKHTFSTIIETVEGKDFQIREDGVMFKGTLYEWSNILEVLIRPCEEVSHV